MSKPFLPLMLLAACLLSACGAHPTTPETPERPSRQRPPAAQPGAYPQQPGMYPGGQPGMYPALPGQPGAAPGGGQAIAAVGRAWSQVRTLSASYDLYEKGSKGVETAKVKFYYKKPSKYRYEVNQHSSSIKNGSKLVFDSKTRKTTARLGGVGGLIPAISGTLDDERSISTRGYTLDKTDYATQTELLLAPGAQVVQTGPTTLELKNPGMYPGCEAMRVTLDPQKMLPVNFELIERGVAVYKKRITGLQLNPSLGSDKFEL